MATKPRPSAVSIAYEHSFHPDNTGRTERDGASDLARIRRVLVPLGRRRTDLDRRHQERVRAKRLDLKHPVRLLHNLANPHRLFQFLLPFRTRLRRLGKEYVRAAQTAIVVDGPGIHHSRVPCALGRRRRDCATRIVPLSTLSAQITKQASTTLCWGISEVD